MLQRIRELWNCTINKPMRRLHSEQVDLYAKLEYGGLSGSVKDRAALSMLEKAIEREEIVSSTVVVESTSGNLGLALAGACRLIGVRFIAVIDPLVNVGTEVRLRQTCFEVIKVRERDSSGGYLLNRRKRVFEQRSRFDDIFFPNQYENPDNFLAYYATLGVEICDQVPGLDYVFISVSSGGTITGVSRRVRERYPQARIVAVDVEGSVIFGGKPRRRHVTGLGSSLVPRVLEHAFIDEVMRVSELEIISGCHRLLKDHAIFSGASSGACYAAIQRYFGKQPANAGARPKVAFVSPDAGDAYLSTIYDAGWANKIEQAASAPFDEQEQTSL